MRGDMIKRKGKLYFKSQAIKQKVLKQQRKTRDKLAPNKKGYKALRNYWNEGIKIISKKPVWKE